MFHRFQWRRRGALVRSVRSDKSDSVRFAQSVWICGGIITGIAAPVFAQPVFTDVTSSAGVYALQWDGVLPTMIEFSFELLFMAGGVAAGDFNNDGWVDLYVTRVNAPCLLYENTTTGGFVEVGASAGVALNAYVSGCGWGDVNNDGFLDLYVLTFSRNQRNYLYINNGDGSFTEDAVNRGVAMPKIPSNETRRYTSVAYGDYDLDGDLDMLVTEWKVIESKSTLFSNDGTGHFNNVTAASGLDMTMMAGFTPRFADIDNDGYPDLAIASDFLTSKLFHNNTDGTFTDITVSAGVGTDENGMGGTTGDIDGDGDLDWFITSIYDEYDTCASQTCNWGASGNRLFENNGTLTFSDATDVRDVRHGYWGWGTSFIDFDNDGDLDLSMTNGIVFPFTIFEDQYNTDPARFWRNEGAGNMTEIAPTVSCADTRSGKGLAVFDYDRDGDLDMFIANNGAYPILYRNDGGNVNDWLQVRLVGHSSNVYGVGAWIEVEVVDGGSVQTHEVSASSNYMSQNDVIAHFGLGSSISSIHEVRVSWPASGKQTILNQIASNQLLVIAEPKPGDCDNDGDVDIDDFTACWSTCESGPDQLAPAGCDGLDSDLDGDVDLEDFARFAYALGQ